MTNPPVHEDHDVRMDSTGEASGANSATAKVVFATRWSLFPFIVGLAVPMGLLGYWYARDLIQLFFVPTEPDGTMAILLLLDKFMVACLLVTTALGTYHIYIRPLPTNLFGKSTWLHSFTAKHLKIFTCLALAGVSSIKLLEDFHEGLGWFRLSEHLAIHWTFLASALVVAYIAKLMHQD
jgi:uncharacterized protein (TIGR00645 family)